MQVVVWGEGVQEEENPGETFLWQMVRFAWSICKCLPLFSPSLSLSLSKKGDAQVHCKQGSATMSAQSCTVMNPGER